MIIISSQTRTNCILPITMDSNSRQKLSTFNLLFLLFLISTTVTDVAGCKTQFSINGMGEKKSYQKCVDLQAQGASIAWTFFPHNKTLDIVFSGHMISSSGWIGWGINPLAPNTMVGTTALIAFRGPSGSAIVLPYYLDNAVKTQQAALVPNKTMRDFGVVKSSVVLSSSSPSSSAMIFATLRLGSNPTSLNHVWNRGVAVKGYSPGIHGTSVDDLKCTKSVQMVSGSVRATPDNPISTAQKLRIIHGILNSISWGFLLFLGVITARYLGQFETLNPAWFYIHVGLQMSGYGIGVAGWAIGLRLGKMSQGVSHDFHRNLGIVIFTLGTLQIFALLFRPKKTHKLRKYWKSYHHFVGYACLIISIVNVFEGINLMGLSSLKLLYSLAISSLIGLCVALEVNSWIMFFKSKREEKDAKMRMQSSHGLRKF